MSARHAIGPVPPTFRDADALPTPLTLSMVSHRLAWFVLLMSLLASTGGWWISRLYEELEANQRFDNEAERIRMALRESMSVYESVLLGVVGLYDSSYWVEHAEWRRYLKSIDIENRFPGLDAVGFVAYVERPELDEFVTRTRSDGVEGFRLLNPSPGEVSYVLKYIEPEERNVADLGSDMFSDPVRRRVADEAWRTGGAVMSEPMKMVQGKDTGQSVVVMMLPIYRRESVTNSVPGGQVEVEGWVYARFVTEQLIQRILGDGPLPFTLEIFDGAKADPNRLLFSSPLASPAAAEVTGRLSTPAPVSLATRNWMLRFISTPEFERSVSRGGSTLVAMGGGVISLLLFWMAWSLSQRRQRAVSMAMDMTTVLRDTNERLEQERFLLRTLMDNVPDRIYFKDAESRFLRNSRAHLERFGLQDMSEVVGRTDFDFFTEEHAQLACADERKIMETGRPITKEERETLPDGPDTWVLSTKMPLRNEQGRIVGTFGISRDITDLKHAEEAMRRAKEEAEAASTAKSHFLASMSHELRTPLNSVIGFATVLLKNKSGRLNATDLNFLERIQANGKHLLSLINQILDLSKIEARKMNLEMAPVELDVLVRETLAQQEGLVRDRPVALIADLPSPMAPLQTDAAKLKQVLINLIGNALKFTDQGSVTVRVVVSSPDNRPSCLEVLDTGIGIEPGQLKSVFEAFRQVEAGTARAYGGTGLGLTISQALCEVMGYRIEVSSQPGKGSVFSILFCPGRDENLPGVGRGQGPTR